MPAEKVYGIQHAVATSDGEILGGSAVGGVPLVDVRWSRDGNYVQVVTKETDAWGGRLVGDDPATHYTDGFHVDLDRAGINDFIRHLRHARDQAFGKDE